MADPEAAIALVHHANQYLVTTGYDDREGIDELVAGYAAVLRLHEERRVPANLHLSGTLLEAAAWHAPWFLELIRRLHASGLVELLGGTYADGIMTVLPQTLNRRSILEHLALCRHHLSCDPREITTFWVPERVWKTSSLAPVLTNSELPNGGFRSVLLDDRLFYPSSSAGELPHPPTIGAANPRRRFDDAGPYHRDPRDSPPETVDVPPPAFVADGKGLVALPISSWLRYCIPPRTREQWDVLERVAASASQDTSPSLLVFADDFERTAGLASWERNALPAYAEFLDWLIAHERLVPVRLTPWLEAHPPRHIAATEPGTFFELTQRGAGEDYRGWWDALAWAPYRRHLAEAEEAIRSAQSDGVDGALVELAWKHLLASTYETAWHEPESSHPRSSIPPPSGPAALPGTDSSPSWAGSSRSWTSQGALLLHDTLPLQNPLPLQAALPRPSQDRFPTQEAPARWARAIASHARSCLPMLSAARSFVTPSDPRADVVDVDRDGEEEAILTNGVLYAVLSPHRGGRLTALFTHMPGGDAAIVGNPSDDWNWQEELHAYMERPPNHPGALSDVGFEHDHYEVAEASASPAGAALELVNVDATSPLNGARKRILLPDRRAQLVVCYRWPPEVTGLAVDLCLSPDYLRLLREGRACLATEGDDRCRGARVGDLVVTVRLAHHEPTRFVEPTRHRVGHGIVFRVRSYGSHFHFVIACGVGAAGGTQPYCPDETLLDFGGALPACRGG